MALPAEVKLVEVGPRDGLQNEKQTVDVTTKVALIEKLAAAGVTYIEAGSFVNPKWVPQMAGSDAVFDGLQRQEGVTYAALTPNMTGFNRAIEANASEVAVFAAASESFSQKNINCSIDASIERFVPLMEAAEAHGIAVRGYVSCVAGCPYEGNVTADKVRVVAKRLLDIGCYEISLGDTIGVGTPGQISALLETVAEDVPVAKLAVHFHDTYGQALANIYAALQFGVDVIDSSVAGLGGCPYAHGASGNVASEDVVYMLNGLGVCTGIDLERLIEAGNFITGCLNRANQSKAGRALTAAQR
ncbi:MAG: hydroxymethylglutaryl-CoA lyase [Pseudomonadales bacterium]